MFEKDNTGLKDSFPDWLHDLDVDKIRKQASEIQFASQCGTGCHADCQPEAGVRRSTRPNERWPVGILLVQSNWLKRRWRPTRTLRRCYFVLAQLQPR